MKAKLVSLIMLTTLLFGSLFVVIAFCEDSSYQLSGWRFLPSLDSHFSNGQFSESDCTFRFSGNQSGFGGPSFCREISPQTDFSFSLQVKAMRLGVSGYDSLLEGFGIFLKPNASIGIRTGVNFELRGAYGGMFLMARYTTTWDWASFVGGNGYWLPNGVPSASGSNPVKTDAWYTMNLTVQKAPFVVTGQVFDQNGNLLGTKSVSDMTNFKFEDIKVIAIGSGWSGDFYVRNISGLPPSSEFSYSPNEPATHLPVYSTPQIAVAHKDPSPTTFGTLATAPPTQPRIPSSVTFMKCPESLT